MCINWHVKLPLSTDFFVRIPADAQRIPGAEFGVFKTLVRKVPVALHGPMGCKA